eukprot:g18964.t1
MRCCSFSLWVTLEEAQDGHVTQGVGGGVKCLATGRCCRLSRTEHYEKVSKSMLGLTDVEENTSGAVDAVDHIDRCAGEPLSDVV